MFRSNQELKRIFPSKPPKFYDSIISGAGPFGLMTAWKIARKQDRKKRQVLVISNRKIEESHVRVQRISLLPHHRTSLFKMITPDDKTTVQALKELQNLEDIKFLLEVLQSSTIAIKDFERFVLRRIKEKYVDQVTFLENSELNSINMTDGVVSVITYDKKLDEDKKIEARETVKEFMFDTVIGADGEKHHTAKIFNESVKQEKTIEFVPIDSPSHPYHVSAYITLEREDGKELNLPERDFLTSHSWTLSYNSQSKSYQEDKCKIKCYFIGELPKEIFYEMQQVKNADSKQKKNIHQKIIAFIQNKITEYFKAKKLNSGVKFRISIVKPSNKYHSKNKLKLQTFQANLHQAKKAALDINGKKLILGGDSFRSPDYRFGHGLNDAMDQGDQIPRLLDGDINVDEYNKDRGEESDSMKKKTSKLNSNIKYDLFNRVPEQLEEQAESRKKELPSHSEYLEILKNRLQACNKEQKHTSP